MPSFYGESDLDAMLATFGVDVVFGATTVKGIRNIADESVESGQAAAIYAQVVDIEVKTGSLPGIAEGSAITVEGVAYRVMQVRQIDDGATTVIQAARSA